jgi:cytochrome c oxidase subunit 3
VSKLLPEEKKKVAKPLLWIGMASIGMAFAGLTSGYVVSRSALLSTGEWMVFSLPSAFTWATATILASSITMYLATRAIGKGQVSKTTAMLVATLVLGILFTWFQVEGARQLIKNGIFFTGPESNTAGSWVYAIAFFHILHLLGGLITLIVTAWKSALGKYSATEKLGVELAAIYWHFLDVLWIYLFLFLVFIR